MREYSRKQLFFSSVAILGPGLLGGSLALAVRKQLPHPPQKRTAPSWLRQ